jgi:NADP-dependent aldehyde dehydrogenase
VGTAIDDAAAELVEISAGETGLPPERLRGEVARTTDQLRMFADIVADGRYLQVIISRAAPQSGAPDVRRILRPVGPVAVFSASNFPFAFSVAGGDTASALAAGCPVVLKAHEGHPRTSQRTAELVAGALRASDAPAGSFSIVHGRRAGSRLVTNRDVRAVGFTGSRAGGRQLFDLASSRPHPIPFFGELGSVNPVVVLPRAAVSQSKGIAEGYVASLLLASGQFCTNPGLLFIPAASDLTELIAEAVGRAVVGPMLTERIFAGFCSSVAEDRWNGLTLLARGRADGAWGGRPEVRLVNLADFEAQLDELSDERFGPAGLVVTYSKPGDLLPVLSQLPGSLTGSIHATDDEIDDARAVARELEPLVGRLIMNGWPTGVAVCWAMHHGGPWPATTAARDTSVGASAINRWLVPIAYQNWPYAMLPGELQDGDPLHVSQVVQ